MSNLKVVGLIIFGIIVVGGGIMLAIYLVNGGEGDSTNIPTNPSDVLVFFR
jgi:hypothetical protein